MASSAISAMRDEMVLLDNGNAAENRLWIIYIGNFICFHDCGIDEVLSNGMRPSCFAIKSIILCYVVSPEALLRSMRNPFNFEDEEQTLSLGVSKHSFGLFTNEG